MNSWTLVLLLALSPILLAGCKKEKSNAAFARANAALEETMARTGDVTYRHEDFDAVADLLRGVPADDAQHGLAMMIANEIQIARATAKRDRASIEESAARPTPSLPTLPGVKVDISLPDPPKIEEWNPGVQSPEALEAAKIERQKEIKRAFERAAQKRLASQKRN